MVGGKVIRYHRTIEEYFGTLQGAGFVVENLREFTATPRVVRGRGDLRAAQADPPLSLPSSAETLVAIGCQHQCSYYSRGALGVLQYQQRANQHRTNSTWKR